MRNKKDKLKVDKFIAGVLESSYTTSYDIGDRSKTEKTFDLTHEYYKKAQEQGESYLLTLNRAGRPIVKFFISETA
jgi:hypothetical protein